MHERPRYASRHLGGKVRGLRFCRGQPHHRVTYWLAPDRRIALLTLFANTQRQEHTEVQRALAAEKACEAQHPAGHTCYDCFPGETP
ncbi:hypothetical protein Sm713_05390 [Streptomyces sp. TS71-3]|nr:hypothetical protein Sm713_05390 [Streptomyces sp. TS71-3]